MMAVLHYVLLKTIRDRSLGAFLVLPMVFIVALLSASVKQQHGLHYPFYMAAGSSLKEDVGIEATIVTFFALISAGLSAFWTFHSEVATKSIGSFVMARRPIIVMLALILFGAATGVVAWTGAMIAIGALSSALPPALLSLIAATVIAALAVASVGALATTVSTQASMVLWVIVASGLLMPWLATAETRPLVLLMGLLLAVFCTGISAFLVERRCAS